MSIERIRSRLFREYVREMSGIDSSFDLNDGAIKEWCMSYIDNANTEWVDIYSYDGQIVGFLIVSWDSSDCHPECDYYICQAYISPLYRNRGLMSRAVNKYINTHKGLYGLDILRNNHNANQFWLNLFAPYRRVDLEEVREIETVKNLMLFGYMVI